MRKTFVLVLPMALCAAETRISFVKDVMPILNKAGCTSGTCHGSAKGKNGFKLSLRGYDPEFDYRALVQDMAGRRFNRTDPARSLMLTKPAQQLPHGGGLRFDTDSAYYKTIFQWITEGSDYGDPVSAQVTKLVIDPPEIVFDKPGLGKQLAVTAHYADGSTRVVTKEAQYSSGTPTIAEVGDGGAVKTERKGESALLVRYEGRLAVVNVTVLPDKAGWVWKPIAENNYIDKFINAKLQKVKVLPSETAPDAEFLRRVSYDLIGLPPSPEETKAFLADKSAAKRARMIDKLMARPEFVDHWSVKWSDLLQVNRTRLGDKGMWAFRDWIREALATNRPYDQMARELITARGSTFQNPPANYFRFTRDPKVAMETTTQLFLGVRMVCAVPRSSVRAVDAEPVFPVERVLRQRRDQGWDGLERGDHLRQTRGQRDQASQGRTRDVAEVLVWRRQDSARRSQSEENARRLADGARQSVLRAIDGEPHLELFLWARHHRACG
jgi:hypothetical protein